MYVRSGLAALHFFCQLPYHFFKKYCLRNICSMNLEFFQEWASANLINNTFILIKKRIFIALFIWQGLRIINDTGPELDDYETRTTLSFGHFRVWFLWPILH